MNATDKFGFIWWATAGCGSRATSMCFGILGVDDMFNYHEKIMNGEGGSYTHLHGFPKGKEDWPVVCNVRNPYSLVVSGYLDILAEHTKRGEKIEYKDYLVDYYFQDSNMEREDPFFLNEWRNYHKEPDYIIHMETMDEDLKSLPFFDDEEKMEEAINTFVKTNKFKNESPHDEYVGEFQKFQRFYNQEIADLVYNNMKEYFIKFGYDKDSWK